MATKYTFYVNSDNINTKEKDKARIKKVMKAFESLGHKAVYVGVGSNLHSHPKKYGCTGKNEVWVCIVGGACAGTIADQTGYRGFGTWFKKEQLKNAHLMYIFLTKPEGASVNVNTIKFLPRAHDDNFSPRSFTGIHNPKDYMLSKGMTWIVGGTTSDIVQKIKTQSYDGVGFDGAGQTNVETKTETVKITHGFNAQNPFTAYIKVTYAIGSRTGEEHSLVIDWQSKAPTLDKVPKFPSDATPQWLNDKSHIYEIDLLSKIQSAERNYGRDKDTKYYLKKVQFINDFKDQYDKKSTEEDESKLYDKVHNKSDYKMALYDFGVFKGEVINHQSLGVNGKTLLDATKTVLDKCKYEHKVTYAERRYKDRIDFSEHMSSEENIAYTFNEGYDGNVLGISNVKYSPTKDLVNDCLTVYKSQTDPNKKTLHYRYTRKAKLGEILRYGEQTHIENLNQETGYYDATQHSYDSLQEYFKPATTFTVKSVGLPPVTINDWVQTEMINPLLTNTFQVASRKINIDVNNRPMIQTEFGLGDVDANIKVKKKLANQRKALVRRQLDLATSIQYEDRNEDEINDMVWIE